MALLTVQGNEGYVFDIQSMLTTNFQLRRGNGINLNISQGNSGSPEYVPDKDFEDKTSTNGTTVQQETSDCEVSDCKDFADKTSTNVTTVQQETSDCEVSDCKANKTMSSVTNGHGKLSNETHSLNMEGKIEAQFPQETTQCEDFAFKAASITMSKVANGHGKSSVETHNPSPSTEGMIEVKCPQQASHCEDPVFIVKTYAASSDTKIPEDEKCTIRDSTLRQLPKEKCTLPFIENINELKTGFSPRRHYSIDEKQKFYSKTKSQFILKKQHHFTFSVVLFILITSGIKLSAAESGCSTPDPCQIRHGNSVKILCIFEENINPSNGEISLWHTNTSGYGRKVMDYFGKDKNFASPDYKIVDNGTKEVGVYISAFAKEHEGKYECTCEGLVNVITCPSKLILRDNTSTNGPNNVSSNILKMTKIKLLLLFLFHLLLLYYWCF